MKACRSCEVILEPGTNWYPSFVKSGNYLCKACNIAYVRKWQADNPEAYAAIQARNFQNNSKRRAEYYQKWKEDHPGESRKYSATYYQRHREVILAKQAVRRARERARRKAEIAITPTTEDIVLAPGVRVRSSS